MGLEELKKRSGIAEIKRLRKAFLEEELADRERSRKWFNKDKIRDALLCEDVDDVDLWNKIEGCGVGRNRWCGSLWCLRCREVISNIMESKIKGYIDLVNDRNREAENIGNDELNMITGFMGLCDLEEDSVLEMIKIDGDKWRRIRRRLEKLNEDKFIVVSYEFELVNWKYLSDSNGSDYKKEQIRLLMKNSGIKNRELFLFGHWHGVSNLSAGELVDVFKDEYFVGKDKIVKMGDCGLYVRRFIKENSLDKNIRKLSSYGFKNVFRYKHSFIGNDYNSGEMFSIDELGKLISVYDKWMGRGYRRVFRECSNFGNLMSFIV